MIRTVIVDDESNAREFLKTIIGTQFPNLEVVGEAADVVPAVELIRETKPDLVLLDIQLKQGTGFDVLKLLTQRKFGVIFITAYNQYAVRAFQFAALGYLLKPVRISDLGEAIERFLHDQEKTVEEGNDPRFKILLEGNESGTGTRKLVLQDQSGFEVVRLEDIIYVRAEVNYSEFYLLDGRKIMVSKTLKEYDNLLNDQGFFRTHQSYLINLSYVKRYLKGEGGQVVMQNGDELPVSRRKKQGFLSKFL